MKWMRDRRQELRLTLEDVAQRLQLEGVSYTAASVGHWETGKRSVPMHDLAFVHALARVLKLDVPTVLRLSGYPVAARYSELSERIASIAERLPENDRRQLLQIAETFLVGGGGDALGGP